MPWPPPISGPTRSSGVETADRFLHLLMLLACEALGVTTILCCRPSSGRP